MAPDLTSREEGPMAGRTGFHRLMAQEENVSDLLQHLTDLDPTPWEELAPGTTHADRESGLGGRKRADLMLRGADGEATGGAEVKLGHVFDESQATAYEKALDTGEPLLLLGLDVDAESAQATGERWRFVRLSALVAKWVESDDPEASAVASAMLRVLTDRDSAISGTLATNGDGTPLSSIRESFSARAITRAIRSRLDAHDGLRTHADVTLGGGNATLMVFRQTPEEREGREFLAEIRWSIPRQVMDLRFGLDYPPGSREERQAVWDAAERMNTVIAADKLIAHLGKTDPERAGLVTANGTGRPRPKGNWLDIVAKGFVTGDGKNYNPGFFRDKDTRLEAKSRIDLSRASGADLEPLLLACLDYLAAHWVPADGAS